MASRATAFRPAEAALFEQRAAERLPVPLTTAVLRKLGKKPVDAILKDVSIYGCRLESRLTHKRGDKVWVQLDDSVPSAATVVWSSDGMTGCRFDVPLDRALVRSLVLQMA